MSAARQLQLAKRENFFSDPLFKDIWSFEDGDLQKRLETFKNKSALAIPGKADTAHNLQVRISYIHIWRQIFGGIFDLPTYPTTLIRYFTT